MTGSCTRAGFVSAGALALTVLFGGLAFADTGVGPVASTVSTVTASLPAPVGAPAATPTPTPTPLPTPVAAVVTTASRLLTPLLAPSPPPSRPSRAPAAPRPPAPVASHLVTPRPAPPRTAPTNHPVRRVVAPHIAAVVLPVAPRPVPARAVAAPTVPRPAPQAVHGPTWRLPTGHLPAIPELALIAAIALVGAAAAAHLGLLQQRYFRGVAVP